MFRLTSHLGQPSALALTTMFAACVACVSAADGAGNQLNPLDTTENPPRVGEPIVFEWPIRCKFDGSEGYMRGGGAQVDRSIIKADAKEVDISFSLGATDVESLSCTDTFYAYKIQFAGVSAAGKYRFNIFNKNAYQPEPFFSADNLVSSFDLILQVEPIESMAEVPFEGSIQSGVGLIRGWACDADSVHVQFDDGPLLEIGYGTSREDTRSICGDNDNGYGMVIAWGLLGLGQHNARTFVDDMEVSSVDFEVAGLSEPFIPGLEGEYKLEDFPNPGVAVIVRWDEASQNFIIVEVLAP